MGSWGEGNFESDNGLDLLGHWLSRIVEEIDQTFENDNVTSLYEDEGEAYIVANVELLCVLSEQYRTRPELTLEQVAKWRTNYLDTFDRVGDAYYSGEHIKKRKRVIEETFNRLRKVIEIANS